MKITTGQLRQIIREEIRKVTLTEAKELDVSSMVSKLDAIAKQFGFKRKGGVNKAAKDGDSVAIWNDTTPGFEKQFIDFYVEVDGTGWVNWGQFGYKDKQAGDSGNDPVEAWTKPGIWKKSFGTIEQRKKG